MTTTVTLLSSDEDVTQDVRVSYWIREEGENTYIMDATILDPVEIEATDVDMDVQLGICLAEGLVIEYETHDHPLARLYKSVKYEVVEPVTL